MPAGLRCLPERAVCDMLSLAATYAIHCRTYSSHERRCCRHVKTLATAVVAGIVQAGVLPSSPVAASCALIPEDDEGGSPLQQIEADMELMLQVGRGGCCVCVAAVLCLQTEPLSPPFTQARRSAQLDSLCLCKQHMQQHQRPTCLPAFPPAGVGPCCCRARPACCRVLAACG
jgi:hypothetical protein